MDGAAEHFDIGFGDAQAESGAFYFAGQGVIDLYKSVENLFVHGCRYADAGVFDGELKHAVVFGISDGNASLEGEFQGVVDQVGEYLGEFCAVGSDGAFAVG